jgi:hypothetical protein
MTTGEVKSAYQSTVTGIQYGVSATVPFDDDGQPLVRSKTFEIELIALFTRFIPQLEADERESQEATTKP